VSATGTLGLWRGTALYVGALVGPGVLLVPALAVQAAGPASILAWGVLLVLSAPLAVTFAALGVRFPVAGGVSAYVRAGFGARAAAVTGGVFLAAVVLGAPAVSLIGGYYVAALTDSGTSVAAGVGLMIFAAVLASNAFGLRVSSGLQLGLSAVLVSAMVIAVAVALPGRATLHWSPFAPHGWLAVGTAASILVWLFVGWEAVAQLAGDFGHPEHDLPRAVALAFAVVGCVYVGLAVATIVVNGTVGSKVPLADLIAVGFGRAGRDATAVLAVALTMGTMNVYLGGAAKLAHDLAEERALPAWVAGAAPGTVPRRPLLLIALLGACFLAALVAGVVGTDTLIRSTSACFVVVYVLALGSAVRLLKRSGRFWAASGLVLVVVVALFSAFYLLIPMLVATVVLGLYRPAGERAGAPAADL
jgi:amino acid efflux transporter